MFEPAPLHIGAEGSPDGQAFWTAAEDGTRLRVALWRAADAAGTVLLFPGRTEYVEKYGDIATALNRAGLSVLAIDWRGQGLSAHRDPRVRMGDVERFLDYQKDVAALSATADALALPPARVLLAHSMGGTIGLRALHRGLGVRAAAFSAPMWGLPLRGMRRPLAWALSSAATRAGRPDLYPPGHPRESYVLTADPVQNTLTSDLRTLAQMRALMSDHPELALGGPSLRWVHEALVEMRALAHLAPPPLRAYTAVGSDERVVDPQAIRRAMSRWKSGEIDLFSGARHEIMMEVPIHRDRFLSRAIALFREAVRS